MFNPKEVAIDPAGDVYVIGNGRVQKFSGTGTFELAWGQDVIDNGGNTGFEVCLPADTCKFGDGSGAAAITTGHGIASDQTGTIYTTTDSDALKVFSSSGTFLGVWGENAVDVGAGNTLDGHSEVCVDAVATCQNPSTGELGGEFNTPRGIGAGGSDVYVGDYGNHRVQKFSDTVPPGPGGGGGGGEVSPGVTQPSSSSGTSTGQRTAALKRCKRKRGAARKKCKTRAKKLPLLSFD